MNPLLISSYRPRYLSAVLNRLATDRVQDRYRVMVWDNGGAAATCARFHVECYSEMDPRTNRAVNVGKAVGVDHLIDVLLGEGANFDCLICMDDDILVNGEQLEELVSAALRPGLGMIGGYYHPFNTPMSSQGSLVYLPQGLCLRVYPKEFRSEKCLGMVAGGLFAIARQTVTKLPWAPYLYPVLYKHSKPVVYWPEDAELDCVLTSLGFTNGYLECPKLTPAIHLPELDENYQRWKHENAGARCDTMAYPRR